MRLLGVCLFSAAGLATLAFLSAVTLNFGVRVGFAVAVLIALPIVWLDERRRRRDR